jgi:hypothetical protein
VPSPEPKYTPEGKLIIQSAIDRMRKLKSEGGKKGAAISNAGRKPKFTKRQIVEALVKGGGFKSKAAQLLGCHPNRIQAYFKRYPDLNKVLEHIDDKYLDMAEFSLLKQVRKENTQATIFYLSRKGKRRGYADPKEAGTQINQQFNLGLPEGGTWLDLMEKAHKDLLAKSGATVIEMAPPPKQLAVPVEVPVDVGQKEE